MTLNRLVASLALSSLCQHCITKPTVSKATSTGPDANDFASGRAGVGCNWSNSQNASTSVNTANDDEQWVADCQDDADSEPESWSMGEPTLTSSSDDSSENPDRDMS